MYKTGTTTPLVQNDSEVRAELTREITEKKMRVEMQNELDRLLAAAQINNFLEEKPAPASSVQTASAKMEIPLKNAPAAQPAPAAKAARQATKVTPATSVAPVTRR
jgi:hypothetical protein